VLIIVLAKSIVKPLQISFSALLIIVRQFNRPYITFPPTTIAIPFSIVVITKIGPDFSLWTKAMFGFRVEALKTESDFN
jgi:hypothetical protein